MRLSDMLYELETVEGAGEGGGVGGLEGTEVAGAATETVDPGLGIEEPAVAGGEEEGAPLTREAMLELVNEGTSNALSGLLERAEHEDRVRAAQQQEAARREQGSNLPEWDPFNPQVVSAHMMETFRPVLEAMFDRFSPALEVAGDYRNSQGEQEANSVLDALGQELENSDFDRDRTVQRAAFLMNRQNMDPEEALRSAAQEQIKFEQELEARGVERFKAQAQNLADGGEELAGGGGAAGEVVQHRRGPQAYRDQLNRSLAARGTRPGVGSPTG